MSNTQFLYEETDSASWAISYKDDDLEELRLSINQSIDRAMEKRNAKRELQSMPRCIRWNTKQKEFMSYYIGEEASCLAVSGGPGSYIVSGDGTIMYAWDTAGNLWNPVAARISLPYK